MHDEEWDATIGGLFGDFIEDSLQGTDSLVVVYIEALNQGCSKLVPPLLAVCELISEVKIGEVNDSRNRVVRHGLSRKSGSAEGRSLEGILRSEVILGLGDICGPKATDTSEIDCGCAFVCEVTLEF